MSLAATAHGSKVETEGSASRASVPSSAVALQRCRDLAGELSAWMCKSSSGPRARPPPMIRVHERATRTQSLQDLTRQARRGCRTKRALVGKHKASPRFSAEEAGPIEDCAIAATTAPNEAGSLTRANARPHRITLGAGFALLDVWVWVCVRGPELQPKWLGSVDGAGSTTAAGHNALHDALGRRGETRPQGAGALLRTASLFDHNAPA